MKIIVTGGSGFIGTNLTKFLYDQGIEFLNVDVVPPKEEALTSFWVNCDILDLEALKNCFETFKPTAVVHMAAQTDTDPRLQMADYKLNTEGTLNVIKAIQSAGFVKRFIHTSTQFVHQGAGAPLHDEDYAPHTVYGESKIINEKQVRSSALNCTWTIIRPTNIWGPWHLRYPFEFWKVLAEGKYFHPGRKPVLRSYGYVGNVVQQVFSILSLPDGVVNQKVYYVGDRPIDLYQWVNGFSLKQTGKKVTVLPRQFIFLLALAGDILRLVRIKFPITLSRYRSMTTDNPVDIEKTMRELGENRYTLQQGIDQTVDWMKRVYPHLITLPN